MGVVPGQDVHKPEGKDSSCENSDVDKISTDYFLPLFEEFNKKSEQKRTPEDFQITQALLKDVFEFTWGPDIFKAPRGTLQRIYKEVSLLFDVSEKQSDLKDMLMYHPVETISSKFCQVFLSIAMIESELFRKNLIELHQILKSQWPRLESHTRKAFGFLYNAGKRLFEVLSGQQIVDDKGPLDELSLGVQDLSRKSKSVISGMKSRFLKLFRVRPRERLVLLKEAHEADPANVEWVIFLSQSLRSGRREQMSVAISKKPSKDELEYVELSLKMEPNNPFVRLGVIECVVDAIREFNGRFSCSHIHLVDLISAIEFLRKECELLCNDFPKNVYFKSLVSDYFARFVPYLYFDKEFSGELLQEAYDLNPCNPKTAHRFGIFYRMNMKNMEESLKWLEKTLELDPSLFMSNMDYFKMILGKPDQYPDVGKRMASILNNEDVSSGWKLTERMDFQFYTGLAFFASGEKEETMKLWMNALSSASYAEKCFTLTDVDADSSIFKWNVKRISPELIRVWMHEEFEKINATAAAVSPKEGDGEQSFNRRKAMVTRMLQLMLNIVSPQKAEPFDGPYTEYFAYGLPKSIFSALIPDSQRMESAKVVRPLGDARGQGQSWRASV